MLKFVYGTTIKDGPKDWYLELDKEKPVPNKSDSNIFASWYLCKLLGLYFEGRLGHFTEIEAKALFAPMTNLEYMLGIDKTYKYMNRAGGFTSTLHDISETKKIPYDGPQEERIKIEFPEKDDKGFTPKQLIEGAKISKWQGGKHYYAKLPDGTEVFINEKIKWGTRKEAEKAIKKFVNRKYK